MSLFGVVLCGFWFWLGREVRRYEHTYRLRLLPRGIRITSCGRTTNYLQPEIVRPRSLIEATRFSLKSPSGRVSLELRNFRREDQARIIEHCSQFLTVAQQAEYGQQWAKERTKLLVAKPIDMLQLWQVTCIASAVSILVSPLLVELSRFHFPPEASPWEVPEVRQHFHLALLVMVVFAPAFFAILYGLNWWEERCEGSSHDALNEAIRITPASRRHPLPAPPSE